MSPLIRRVATTVAATALAATAALSPASAASTSAAAPAPDRLAGDWLSAQLDKGLVHNDQYDFDDLGLTVDVASALVLLGGHQGDVVKTTKALRKRAAGYTTGADFGTTDVYAGATAKLLHYAVAVGANPRHFGGLDLVAQLDRRVTRSGAAKGRIADRSQTDYANVVGQVYAAVGLTEAGGKRARAARAFLLEQQCTRGFFRLDFAAPGAADQSCQGAAKADRAPDTDVTALAVALLDGLEKQTPATRKAVARGSRWLARHQRSNGSFGGGTSTEAPNTNSTGLAAWALAETGRCAAARHAARWVAKRQVPAGASAPLRSAVGAIAYDRAGQKAAASAGITKETQDEWRRASAQAAPALLFLDRASCAA